jgi:serine/threonine protein kinase
MEKRNARELSDLETDYPHLILKRSQYVMGDVLGEGGFGKVFKAVDRATQKEIAIKQLFEDKLFGPRLLRFIAEIRTMARCNHFFLVSLVGFTIEPPFCIATEFMPGGSLDTKARIRKGGGALTGSQLTIIVMGISHAMAHIHSNGIVHRDLKTANILLDKYLFPHIADFGTATFEKSDGAALTAKLGTPNYMAPELIQGQAYTNKVDVYSFGMILYELVEGLRPFAGLQPDQIFQRVVEEKVRPPFSGGAARQLEKLAQRCWAQEPDKRPTFQEIYAMFKTGQVAFPDAKTKEIQKFDVLIEKDEAKRAPARVKMAQDFTVRQQSRLRRKSYAIIARDALPPREHGRASVRVSATPRRFNAQTPSIPIGEKLAWADIASAGVAARTMLDPSVLADPSHPAFEATLVQVAPTTNAAGTVALVQPLTEHMRNEATPLRALTTIVTAIVRMMESDHSIVPEVAKTHFFYVLPVTREPLLDLCVRAALQLFNFGQ